MSPWLETHGIGVIAYATLGFWVVGEVVLQLRRRRGEHTRTQVDTELRFRLLATVLIAPATVLAVNATRWLPATAITPGVVPFVVGEVVLATGVAVRLWAVVSLGRWFTLVVRTSAEQPVIDSGPYRWVRHPSYTGLLLALEGVGVLFGSWLGVIGLVVLPPLALAYRIRVEERALLADLGDRYRDYAAGRKRLVPGVW